MNSQMQLGNFTHAKCTACGHLGDIRLFDSHTETIAESGDGSMKMEILKLKCPICISEFCEALFINEVQ